MRENFSRIIIALILVVACSSAKAAVINGILVDATDTTELMQANVQLLKADKDSTYVMGTITDMNGVFNLENVPEGRYLVKCSYIGYEPTIKRVSVGADGRDVNLGMIYVSQNTVVLKETVVMGVKTAITVKEDTIEYNADTYKTQANAVVEDLLKRMPGVEVSSDGKITANGKEVKKILIDGKEFFSDDPTMASKNIPADMINKLQVIDRKSDLARLTGVDDGEDETVINLTVKKGMNNGWFGTVTAGYGTDKRYLGNVIANYFNNGNQFTFTGNANNTNNVGFGLHRRWLLALPPLWWRPRHHHVADAGIQLQRGLEGRRPPAPGWRPHLLAHQPRHSHLDQPPEHLHRLYQLPRRLVGSARQDPQHSR